MPTRFRGSAPLTATSSPAPGSRRTDRNRPIASGSAYCSPENPPTKRPPRTSPRASRRSEEHTSELQSHHDIVCRLLLEKKKKTKIPQPQKNKKKQNKKK